MRKGIEPEFIGLTDTNTLIGINMSHDYVTDHEFGIESILRGFGVNYQKASNITEAVSTETPREVIFLQKNNLAVLLYNRPDFESGEQYLSQDGYGELYFHKNKDLATAWSEKDFGVLVRGEQNVSYLKDLYKGIKEKNICFLLGKAKPFGGRDLIIAIASRIPKK